MQRTQRTLAVAVENRLGELKRRRLEAARQLAAKVFGRERLAAALLVELPHKLLELGCEQRGLLADLGREQKRRLGSHRHLQALAVRNDPLHQLALQGLVGPAEWSLVELPELVDRAACREFLRELGALVELLRLEHEHGAVLDARRERGERSRVALHPAVAAAHDDRSRLRKQAASSERLQVGAVRLGAAAVPVLISRFVAIGIAIVRVAIASRLLAAQRDVLALDGDDLDVLRQRREHGIEGLLPKPSAGADQRDDLGQTALARGAQSFEFFVGMRNGHLRRTGRCPRALRQASQR